MKPLVSVLIPAYNAERWLAATLRSALSQTWEDTEIIVVDDGSTDGTLALARTFESDRMRVFAQAHQGAAAARNRAFSLCRGAYIQWLDADDLLARDKIAKQMEAIEDPPNPQLLLCGEWSSFMRRPSRATFVPSGLWSNLSKTEWLLRKMEQNTYMQTASWLVSRELTEAAGPWDVRLLVDDDGEYFCRVLLASDGVRFVRGAKVYYRQTGRGCLSYIGESNPKRDAQWLSIQKHIGYLRSLDDGERARAACVTFLQTWIALFYPDRMDIVEKAETLSGELGGKLQLPAMSWKYSWIKVLFGWRVAKWVQIQLRELKWAMLRGVDGTLSCFERAAVDRPAWKGHAL